MARPRPKARRSGSGAPVRRRKSRAASLLRRSLRGALARLLAGPRGLGPALGRPPGLAALRPALALAALPAPWLRRDRQWRRLRADLIQTAHAGAGLQNLEPLLEPVAHRAVTGVARL